MKFKEIENIIIQDGWYYKNTKGSHHQYKHPYKKGKVTIPRVKGNDDLDKGTFNSILKQAGLK